MNTQLPGFQIQIKKLSNYNRTPNRYFLAEDSRGTQYIGVCISHPVDFKDTVVAVEVDRQCLEMLTTGWTLVEQIHSVGWVFHGQVFPEEGQVLELRPLGVSSVMRQLAVEEVQRVAVLINDLGLL